MATLATFDWTGTNGAVWGTGWSTAGTGTVDIQSNAGRILVGSTTAFAIGPNAYYSGLTTGVNGYSLTVDVFIPTLGTAYIVVGMGAIANQLASGGQPANGYAIELAPQTNNFTVNRHVTASRTTLFTGSHTYTAGSWVRVNLTKVGSVISATVWDDPGHVLTAQPGTPDYTATDGSAYTGLTKPHFAVSNGSGTATGRSASFDNMLLTDGAATSTNVNTTASGTGSGAGTASAVAAVLASASGTGTGAGTVLTTTGAVASTSGTGAGAGSAASVTADLAVPAAGTSSGAGAASTVVNLVAAASGTGDGTGTVPVVTTTTPPRIRVSRLQVTALSSSALDTAGSGAGTGSVTSVTTAATATTTGSGTGSGAVTALTASFARTTTGSGSGTGTGSITGSTLSAAGTGTGSGAGTATTAVAYAVTANGNSSGDGTASATPAVAFDTFTRANTTSTLGVADSGHTWANYAGNFGVNSNQAYCFSGPGTARIDLDVPNLTVAATLAVLPPATNTYMGVLFNGLNSTNYYFADVNSAGAVRLFKMVGGASTSLGAATGFTAGGVLGGNVTGSTVTVTLNGVTIITGIADAALAAGGAYGLRYSSTTPSVARWDDFSVTGVPGSTAATRTATGDGSGNGTSAVTGSTRAITAAGTGTGSGAASAVANTANTRSATGSGSGSGAAATTSVDVALVAGGTGSSNGTAAVVTVTRTATTEGAGGSTTTAVASVSMVVTSVGVGVGVGQAVASIAYLITAQGDGQGDGAATATSRGPDRDITVTIIGPYHYPLGLVGPYANPVTIAGPYNYPVTIHGPAELADLPTAPLPADTSTYGDTYNDTY